MEIHGYEISRFWFFYNLFALTFVAFALYRSWSDDITMQEMWYLIPEVVYLLMASVRMICAVIATVQKKPGCSCFRATALYIEAGARIDEDYPVISRIPAILGRMQVFLTVAFLISSVAVKISVGKTTVRSDILSYMALSYLPMSFLQFFHLPCAFYYHGLILLWLSRGMAPLEDVVVDHGPVDMSPYCHTVTDEELAKGMDCAICTDRYQEGERVAKLPCEHLFHETCAATWIRRVNSCPLCRTHVEVNRLSRN